MTRTQANLLLLACAAVWGVAFVFQKRAMAHLGPFWFIALRTLVAMAVLSPLVWRENRAATKRGSGRLLRSCWWAGLAFFGGSSLQQTGLITSTATNAGFITALYVVVTPFLAWLMMRHRPRAPVWAAVALAFLGAWLLGGGSLSMFTRGDGLIALSAVMWAFHVVLVGLGATEGRAATFTAGQFGVVASLALGAALGFETFDPVAIQRAAVDLLYVGVLSSALTFTLLTVALRFTRPAEAAVLLSTESLFAALGAYVLLGERLTVTGWTGAAMLFGASLLVQVPLRRN